MFQDHLERVGIAWPNPGMYRTLPQPRPSPSTPMTPCGPGYQLQPFGYTPDSMQKRQLEVRLPSDQLNKVISAFKQYPGGFNTDSPSSTAPDDSTLIMPPPPLPTHAQKRAVDHSSDVSMHAGCTHFPTCTTEDEKGHLIHSSPLVGSSAVKGKKEGSSSPMKRKFCA